MNKEIIHCPSLVDVVRLRAQNTPNKVSCTFINKDLEEKMTYSDLDQHARAIAAMLQIRGAQPGDRILLLFSPGLPFIQAFWLSLRRMHRGSYSSPAQKLLEKAHRIISNAKPAFAIMTSDHVNKFSDPDPEGVPHIDQIPCITIEELKLTQSNEWRPLRLTEIPLLSCNILQDRPCILKE